MRESIEFPVILPNGNECDMRICVDNEENTFDIVLDNKIICSGDWHDNFRLVLKRALELWNVNDAD